MSLWCTCRPRPRRSPTALCVPTVTVQCSVPLGRYHKYVRSPFGFYSVSYVWLVGLYLYYSPSNALSLARTPFAVSRPGNSPTAPCVPTIYDTGFNRFRIFCTKPVSFSSEALVTGPHSVRTPAHHRFRFGSQSAALHHHSVIQPPFQERGAALTADLTSGNQLLRGTIVNRTYGLHKELYV